MLKNLKTALFVMVFFSFTKIAFAQYSQPAPNKLVPNQENLPSNPMPSEGVLVEPSLVSDADKKNCKYRASVETPNSLGYYCREGEVCRLQMDPYYLNGGIYEGIDDSPPRYYQCVSGECLEDKHCPDVLASDGQLIKRYCSNLKCITRVCQENCKDSYDEISLSSPYPGNDSTKFSCWCPNRGCMRNKHCNTKFVTESGRPVKPVEYPSTCCDLDPSCSPQKSKDRKKPKGLCVLQKGACATSSDCKKGQNCINLKCEDVQCSESYKKPTLVEPEEPEESDECKKRGLGLKCVEGRCTCETDVDCPGKQICIPDPKISSETFIFNKCAECLDSKLSAQCPNRSKNPKEKELMPYFGCNNNKCDECIHHSNCPKGRCRRDKTSGNLKCTKSVRK